MDQITVVGASKGHGAPAIAAAYAAGLTDLGKATSRTRCRKWRNLRTPQAVASSGTSSGHCRANKTRAVARNFAWVHTVDRLRIAERLSAQRPYHAPPLNVCVQVHIGGEAGKAGAEPEQIPQLLRAIGALPRLKLRGLMCLPPPEADPMRQRYWLHQLKELFESVNADGAGLDTLSMGMSADLEAAVHEGATLVRIGTDLFGPRPPHPADPV